MRVIGPVVPRQILPGTWLSPIGDVLAQALYLNILNNANKIKHGNVLTVCIRILFTITKV